MATDENSQLLAINELLDEKNWTEAFDGSVDQLRGEVRQLRLNLLKLAGIVRNLIDPDA